MKYIFFLFLLFFSGCSIKNYENNQSKIIIIKSPKIKFADIGYLRHTDDKVELEMFIAGTVVEKIQINHLVCVREGCLSKSGFNKEYLNESYPDEMLQHVLLGRSIYDGENRVRTTFGHVQKIKNKNVDIVYKTSTNEVFFKDRKNKIIFKLKEIK